MSVGALSIMSLNSARKGLLSLGGGNQRKPYLEKILGEAKPDICFFPGDDPDLKKNVFLSYEQYLTPNKNDTVLLWKPERLSVREHNVNFSTFGPIPGVNYDLVSCPLVDVLAPKPSTGHILKSFTILAWRWDMLPREASVLEMEKMVAGLIFFAQRLAMATDTPLFIGGEIPLPYERLVSIIKERNQAGKKEFLNVVHPQMEQSQFTPSMTEASTTTTRHKFEMNVVRCQSSIVQARNDFFIVSKDLEIEIPKLLDIESVIGKSVKVKTLQEYPPTCTSMSIPARPPLHHGG